jgi:hypothetical protein
MTKIGKINPRPKIDGNGQKMIEMVQNRTYLAQRMA